jgi:uncharacterized protein
MQLSIFESSIPIFERGLQNCTRILSKAVVFQSRQTPVRDLVTARLSPDMFALDKQVIIAVDGARGCAAHLCGLKPVAGSPDRFAVFDRGYESDFDYPRMTLHSLVKYVENGIQFLGKLNPESFLGSETREILLVRRGKRRRFVGSEFLLKYALPNFYFHLSITYAILRREGVLLGKDDFTDPPAYSES